MSKPHIPQSPVPMLTEVVQVNGSLRPAVFPWAPQAPKIQPHQAVAATASGEGDGQEILADKVLERVQAKLAMILPEMLRTAVDEVLIEYLKDSNGQQTPNQGK